MCTSITPFTNVTPPKTASKFIEIKSLQSEQSKIFLFSFACFDRNHKLFNLGEHLTKPQVTDSEWFLDLLDSLKEASSMRIEDFKKKYDMHPLERDDSNIKDHELVEQYEYYSFDVTNESRVIGFKCSNIFYVQWLDKHHNHCDIDGYGTIKYYCRPISYIEKLNKLNNELKAENDTLKEETNSLKENFDFLYNQSGCDNCQYKLATIKQ